MGSSSVGFFLDCSLAGASVAGGVSEHADQPSNGNPRNQSMHEPIHPSISPSIAGHGVDRPAFGFAGRQYSVLLFSIGVDDAVVRAWQTLGLISARGNCAVRLARPRRLVFCGDQQHIPNGSHWNKTQNCCASEPSFSFELPSRRARLIALPCLALPCLAMPALPLARSSTDGGS